MTHRRFDAAGGAPPDDPLDVAAVCRERADAEAFLAGFVEHDTIAGAALQTYLWRRQVAWAEAALLIERATRAHTLGRYWHAVHLMAHRAGGGDAAAAPVFRTAADTLAETLVRRGGQIIGDGEDDQSP